MSCYISWNGRESVLASLLGQNEGELVRDRVMSYVYSNEFKDKFGDFRDPYTVPEYSTDDIGKEPSYAWVKEQLLKDSSANEAQLHINNVKEAIQTQLPKEVADTVSVIDVVPDSVLGRRDLFFAMKDVFESNGITDTALINWAGINKSIVGHPKGIKNTAELEAILEKSYEKLSNPETYIELKTNPLAAESFDAWKGSLQDYPLTFRHLMLTHAVKWLRNPDRRSKYVLQLSSVALRNTYGLLQDKPHEANRIGKLYDQEVLKTVSDAIGHEPSASGKGYWVHVPRTENKNALKNTKTLLRDNTNDPNAPAKFTVEYMTEDGSLDLEMFETREEAERFEISIKGNNIVEDNTAYKTNVELLRKLSPSTWCTSGSAANTYVEDYDNYVLIVNGRSVAGIEVYPGEGIRKVKEVTSVNNNGVASIDFLDDTIAFFEKKGFDTNNTTLQRAISARDENKTDESYANELEYDFDNPFDNIFQEEYQGDYEQDYYNPFEEMGREVDDRYDEIQGLATSLTTVEETIEFLNNPDLGYSSGYFFENFTQELRNNYDIAKAAVESYALAINYVDSTLPFYEELGLLAFSKNKNVYTYLSPELQAMPGLLTEYAIFTQEEEDELPFSKTEDAIQGYYDAKNDKVVVVASNITTEEAAKVAIHEVAHRGMLRMAKELGGTKELYASLTAAESQLMEKLPELLERTGHKNLEALMLDYGFTTNSEDGKAKLLMELAARWAETLVDKPKPSWWIELLQSIGQWIQNFTGKTLTEKEVNELVGGFVRYGSTNNIETTALSPADTVNIYAGTGENAELSNFAPRPFEIGGIKYNSVEQAFQHAKLAFAETNEQNLKVADAIMRSDGAMAKSLGKKFVSFNTKEWDSQASSVMKTLLKESFKQNPEALAKLQATGNATLTHTQDKGKWGKEFPKLLMEVRSELTIPAPPVQTVEGYRAQEQAELIQRIPNIEDYKVDGKVDKSLITDEAVLATYNEIYDKYDKLITPLLNAPAPPPPPSSKPSFVKKGIFTVTPAQAADKKATIKASIATQYIGFGEGIPNSSTELYRQQAGQYANTGNYSSSDVIFVSIGGKRGTEQQQKTQQDRTIQEALKAIEAGSTLITDNRDYINSSTYNTGEKRLYKNLEAKGYNYSEVTIDGQTLGVWTKNNTVVPAPPSAAPVGPTLLAIKVPEGTKRVKASERTSEDIEAIKSVIQRRWVDEALANPDKQYKVGYENPNKNKYQDDYGFYVKEYAEYLDDIRLEMGEDFPTNLTFFPAFEFAMNSNPARLMKVFSSRIEELQKRKEDLNVDPLINAEIAARMEVVVVDSNGTTLSYFTKDHGGNAQKEVTDTILSAMYTKYLSTTVPPSVDTLFEEGLKTIVRAQIEAKKKGDTKRETLWGDVRRSFAFKDDRVSFMSLMLNHFEALGFSIDRKAKNGLLSKYDKLKNDTSILEKVTETVLQVDLVEGDYNLVLEESGDDINFDQSRGTSLKDWSDSAFEQDPRTTAGARLKMWLSTQYRKQKATYRILDDSTGIPMPPGSVDITEKIPSMEWLTGLKLGQQLQIAFALNGKQCSHKTLGPQIQEYFDTMHPTVPVLNSLGMQSLVQFDTLLASILDELSSTPDMTLELAISKLKGSGNSDLFETGTRLEKASERDQNEFLKVTNLQYVKGVVIKANPKKDDKGQEYHQVRVIEAQQFGQRQTVIKKWKERNALSAVVKKRADGSRTIDLDRTTKQVEAIKVLAMLSSIPTKEYVKGQTVEEKKAAEELYLANMQVFLNALDSALNLNREYFSGITAQMLVEDELGKVLEGAKKRDFSSKRSLQGKTLQLLFREHGVDLNDAAIQDLVGVYIKPGKGNEKATVTDKVAEWTKGTKLQGDWLSQYSFSLEGKPKGMFSAFFGKAAGLFTDKDLDLNEEELEDQVMDNNPLYTETTTINALANVARKHTENLHTNSHKNAENKTVWDYSLNTALSNEVQRFVNNSEEMRKVYFKTQLLSYQDASGNIVSGNWHLNRLLENKDKFGITFLEGLNYNNRSKGTTRTNMSDREQLLSVAGAYFNEGRPFANMVSLTHSDKTVTPIFTGVPKIKISEVANNGVIGLNVQEAFFEVFMAEYRRALQVQSILKNGDSTGDAQLDAGGTNFFFLPLFNKESMRVFGTEQMLYAEDGSLLETIGNNKPLFLELISNFLRDEIKKESEKWAELGIEYKHLDRSYQKSMQNDLDNTPNFGKLNDLVYRKQNTKVEERNQIIYNNAIKEFTLNTLLWNMNSTMLFTGDPAQNWKPSKIASATEADNINSTFSEFAKRLAKDIAPGQTLNFTKPTFRTLTIADVKEKYEYITKFGGNIEDSNAGDAQEFTTVQEHLDVMLAGGLIEKDLYNELSGIAKGEDYEFTDAQLDQMMQPMQAMKPVYTGFRDPSNGFRMYDYIKTSSYPLLPQFTKGLEIDKVRQMMEKGNIQRIVFESGRKMGGPTNKTKLFKANKDGVIEFTNPDASELESSVQTLDRKNFRIQQDVPYDRDKEAIKVVSQMNKLIVESIGDFNDFDIEGFGKGKSGKQVREYKESIKRKMIQYNLKTLKQKLGIQTGADGTTSPLDRKKILNLMIEEAKSRGYSTNDLVLIERLIEYKDDSGRIVDTDFDFPLFLHPAVEKFESLLMSIVRKVTEFKMPGKSYVQAASVGYNRVIKEGEVDSRGMIYVAGYDSSQPLRHMQVVDGVVKPAQVLAPFNFYGKDAEGNDIKYKITDFLKEGTNELDTDRVPKEFLQLIGARIPNQGHNSMIAMEIVGFVPDWMGDTLIVPSAITGQMGSDFDVDKLFTYKRPYTFDGSTVKRINKQTKEAFADEYVNNIIEATPEGETPRDVSQDEIDAEYAKVPDTKESLQEDYFNVHWGVLTNRDLYSKVLSSLDKPDLGQANKKFATNDTTRGSFWSSRTQQEMFQAGKDAKTLVGLTSLAVTFNSVLQGKALQYGSYTKIKGGYKKDVKYLKLNGMDFSSLSGTGTIERDGVTYSKHDNQTIFQSGAVDNAKDRTLDNLNITIATYPAIQVLHQLETNDGEILTTDFSTAMMVQEILWEYSKEMRQGNDSMSDSYTNELSLKVQDELYKKYATEYYELTQKTPEPSTIQLTTEHLTKAWDTKNKAVKIDKSRSAEMKRETYLLTQLATLNAFGELLKIGERLGQLQKTLNQDTNGAGPNVLYASQQMENFTNISIPNEFKSIINEESILSTGNELSEQADTFLSVIPLAMNLGEKVFPLELMQKLISTVALNSNIQLSEMSLDTQRKIIRDLRSAVLSSSTVLAEDPTAERVNLLYGTETTDSLALRLDSYKERNPGNYFLERLHTKVNLNGKGPDYVEYVNATAVRMDEELNVSDFMKLINSEDPEAKELGDDLVKYALLLTPQAGPKSFISKVPAAVLLGTRFSAEMRNSTQQMVDSVEVSSGFIAQLYQHNPDLAMEVSEEVVKANNPLYNIPDRTYPEVLEVDRTNTNLELADGFTPYIRYYDKTEGKVILYKLFSQSDKVTYQRIDILGDKNSVEYDLTVSGNNSSIFVKNKAGYKFGAEEANIKLATDVERNISLAADEDNAYTRWGIQPDGGLENVNFMLTQLNNDPAVPTFLRTLANVLSKQEGNDQEENMFKALGIDRELKIKTTLENQGSAGQYAINNTKTTLTLQRQSDVGKAATVLVHEVIHQKTSIFTALLGWGKSLKAEQIAEYRKQYPELYKKFTRLDALRYEALKAFEKDLELNGLTLESLAAMRKDGTMPSGTIHKIGYALSSLDEFIAHIQTDPDVMKFLNSVESTSARTFLERVLDSFLELIQDVMNAIGGINEKSILREALSLAYNVTNQTESEFLLIENNSVSPQTVNFNTESNALSVQQVVEGIYGKQTSLSTDGIGHQLNILNQSKAAKPSAELQKVLDKIQVQMRTLDGVLSSPVRSADDKIRRNQALRLFEEIQDDYNHLSTTKDFMELSEVADKQLEWVKATLAKPTNHVQEVIMATSILDTWGNIMDLYEENFTLVNPAFQEVVKNIQNSSALLMGSLKNSTLNTLIAVGASKGLTITKADLGSNIKDLNVAEQQALALSRDTNKVSQLVALVGQNAANNAQEEQTMLRNKMNKVLTLLGNDKATYAKFIQENDTESAFGLVQELHPDWYSAVASASKELNNTLWSLDSRASLTSKDANVRKKAIAARKKALKAFWSSMSKVGKVVDYTKLFSMEGILLTTPEATAEYNALLAFTGSKSVVDDIIEDAQNNVKKYYEEYLDNMSSIEVNTKLSPEDNLKVISSLTAEEKLLDPLEQLKVIKQRTDLMLAERIDYRKRTWISRNSPFEFMATVNPKASDAKFSHSGRFKPLFVPKAGDQMFDKKYKELMADPKLKEAYDTFVELSKLYRSYLPPKVSSKLHDNFLPVINIQDVASMYKMIGELGWSKVGQVFLNSFTVSKFDADRKESSEIPIKFTGSAPRDPITGKVDFEKVSIDLPRIFEMFGNIAIHYRHMYPAKEFIDLAQRVIQNESKKRQNSGEGSLSNLEELLKFYKDTLVYKKPLAVGGVASEAIYSLNPSENKRLKERVFNLNQELKELEAEEQINPNVLLDDTHSNKKKAIVDELAFIESTARYASLTKVGDTLIGINQLKAMSYNPFSAVSNFSFGYMSGFIHARGFRAEDKETGETSGDYTAAQLRMAYSLMKGNIARSWGSIFNLSGSDTALKCKAIIERIGMVDALSDTTYGKTNLENFQKKGWQKTVDPFAWQKSGDFLTKGAVMIAMTLNKHVEVTENGVTKRIPLFDALSIEAKWDVEKYGENETWQSDKDIDNQVDWNKFRNKVRKVGILVFGNQDRNSPLMARKNLIGRLISQFRLSWIPEGFNTRWGNEYEDAELGRTVSGRYRTMFNMKGFGVPTLIRQVLSTFNGSDAFEGVETKQWEIINGEKRQVWKTIQAHEKENMRRNLAGMTYTAAVLATLAILRAGLPDEEEMRRRKRMGIAPNTGQRMLINMLYRMQQDLQFYSNPFVMDQIVASPIPAWNVLKDFMNIYQVVGILQGEDKDKYERALKKITKAFPYLNLYNKIEFMTSRDISAAVR
jgi:hypothetical protein